MILHIDDDEDKEDEEVDENRSSIAAFSLSTCGIRRTTNGTAAAAVTVASDIGAQRSLNVKHVEIGSWSETSPQDHALPRHLGACRPQSQRFDQEED